MKLSRRQLASAWRGDAAGPCLDKQEIQRAARSELGAGERERVVDHLVGCAPCAETVKMVRALDGWAGEAAGEQRPQATRRRMRYAIAALFIVTIAAGALWVSLRSGVPDPDAFRGPEANRLLLATTPRDGARLRTPPEALSITGVAGPDERYIVTLYDGGMAPIWRSAEGTSTSFVLPESVRNRLGAGQRYYWRVTEVQGVSDRDWPLITFELIVAPDADEPNDPGG
jgi:hypothetical protein